jgi:thiamine pyrophosphate-dependent acetolactate synthase large subunit-like protein
MNGAEALIETLAQAGVEICFANPGTSEMQLVAAIDRPCQSAQCAAGRIARRQRRRRSCDLSSAI